MADLLPYQWYDIEDYPHDGVDGGWGPHVLVRVPPSLHYPHGQTHYTAHLEAGMWLCRSAEDPDSWSELAHPPTHFMYFDEVEVLADRLIFPAAMTENRPTQVPWHRRARK